MTASLQLGWLAVSAVAAAASVVVMVVRRFPHRARLFLSGAVIAFESLLVIQLRLVKVVNRPTFLWSLAIILAGPTYAYLGRIGMSVERLVSDPLVRRNRGLRQYEGRNAWQWVLLLMVSPWHIARYRRHVLADPKSPLSDKGRPPRSISDHGNEQS